MVNDTVEIVLDTDIRSIVQSEFEQGEALADKVIRETEEKQDIYHALNYLSMFHRVDKITGIASCKILYYIFARERSKYKTDDEFYHMIRSYTGFGWVTIKRYIAIWDLFAQNKIPELYQEELKQKPLNTLVPIIGTLNAGYEVSNEHWEEIIDAKNNPEVSRILREKVRGQEPSEKALYFEYYPSTGMFYAVSGGKRSIMAKFAVNSNDNITKRGIQRLLANQSLNIHIMEE